MTSYIKKLPTSMILKSLAKVRKEQAHKKAYGNYGTGKYVSSTEFHGRKGIAALKAELERRKKKGMVSKRAGKSRKTRRSVMYNPYWGI